MRVGHYKCIASENQHRLLFSSLEISTKILVEAIEQYILYGPAAIK